MTPLERIVTFLKELGLTVREEPLPAGTFLPGLAIRGGALLFDPARLTWPGDLLHEAGHLAVLPATLRATISDDQLVEGGEVESIAWSFAALQHLGLPLELLFHAGGYRGGSEGLKLSFSLGVYPGVPGLEAAGLTAGPRRAAELGVPAYPRMLRWLRDA